MDAACIPPTFTPSNFRQQISMSTYNIQWSSSCFEKLASERYAHFFAIVQRGELMYVGKAYHSNLTDLIPACTQQLDLDHLSLTLFLGRIREVGTGRINEASVNAIHDLLVFARKPRYNLAGKFVYQGQADLQLANVGCQLLPTKLRAENNRVFVGKPMGSISAEPISAR
jgi:hypothetical protein